MAEGSKKIWCGAGQISVILPDEAFNPELMALPVDIVPCDGCNHAHHVKETIRIKREVGDLAELGQEYRLQQQHHVQVINYTGKQHVQCTCNCGMTKVE